MSETAVEAPAVPIESVEEEDSGGWSIQRITIVSVGALLAVYVLLFVIGLIVAIAFGEGAARWFGYFKDLVNIAVSVSTLVIVVGVGVLVIQVARFVNLLRSEVKPITEDAQTALAEVRTTAQFVQKHSVSPIIKGQSFLAGVLAFLREIIRLTQVLQRRVDEEGDE